MKLHSGQQKALTELAQIVNNENLPAPYAFVQLIASPSAIDWVQIRKVR